MFDLLANLLFWFSTGIVAYGLLAVIYICLRAVFEPYEPYKHPKKRKD